MSGIINLQIEILERKLYLYQPRGLDFEEDDITRFKGKYVSTALIENGFIQDIPMALDFLSKIINISGNVSVYGGNAKKVEDSFDAIISTKQLNNRLITTTTHETLDDLLEWVAVFSHPETGSYREGLIILLPGSLQKEEIIKSLQSIKHEND